MMFSENVNSTKLSFCYKLNRKKEESKLKLVSFLGWLFFGLFMQKSVNNYGLQLYTVQKCMFNDFKQANISYLVAISMF